ncbi:hypothetical protein [Planctomyces sp. SH-PL14]|uniref:hypothetical protein n=1 Tax=Planctomyces sp. SH-PL14 TaxID=1632864 RepID=UPI00078D1C49|nr:hypothetical protein [Planctomyces sp. SH-PL14]AMV16579.1 hypothetical protein VT03_01735 [Planctomyces sp. SH-PL14]
MNPQLLAFYKLCSRFDEEFAFAWNERPESRELLEASRPEFDGMRNLIRSMLLNVFRKRGTYLLWDYELTGSTWQPYEEVHGMSYEFWMDHASEFRFGNRHKLPSQAALWATCPPIGTPPAELWSMSAPSAAYILFRCYYAFISVIRDAVYTALRSPCIAALDGTWVMKGGVAVPEFTLSCGFYHIRDNVFGAADPVEQDNGETLPSLIDTEKTPNLFTYRYLVCEEWADPDGDRSRPGYQWCCPSLSYFDWELVDSVPTAGSAAGAIEGVCAQEGAETPPWPITAFEDLTNSQLADILEVTIDTVAKRRKAILNGLSYPAGSRMGVAMVREILWFFVNKGGSKEIQNTARKYVEERTRKADSKPT